MAKQFTKQELEDMGMNEQQIAAIISTYDEERAHSSGETIHIYPGSTGSGQAPVSNVIELSTSIPSRSPQDEQLQVTTVSQIQSYASGCVVRLPDFGEGQPFIARLRRPSLLNMVKLGKIPNSLIEQATALFAKGAESMVGRNGTTLGEMCEIIDVIIDAALMEPTLKEIQQAGIDLSDDQKMAIFSYTQQGIKALEPFRTK